VANHAPTTGELAGNAVFPGTGFMNRLDRA
jgi:hypothetical protein